MKNKKGQAFVIPIIAFVIVAVAIAVVLIVGSFSILFSQLKYFAIGGAIILVSIIFGFKTGWSKDKGKYVLLFIIIGSLFILIPAFGVLQQILSVSTYSDNQGNMHWLIHGIANNIGEGYTFIVDELPPPIKIGDKTITPKEKAVLLVSKKQSYCSYQLDKVDRFLKIKVAGITIKTIDVGYYQLLNAERVALISVKDDLGTEKIIDGTLEQTTSFYKNNGKLELTTFGTSSVKKDCVFPDVAIIIKDDTYTIYNKNDYDRKIGNLDSISFLSVNIVKNIFNVGSLINYIRTKPNLDTQFVKNFNDYEFKNDRFIGYVDIGSVNFVIDADQKYYNSFVYTPPKEIKPNIDSIIVSDIQADFTGSVAVKISNRADSEGNVVIKASVDRGSISPEGENIMLKTSITRYFIIKAPNLKTSDKVCFEVCSVSSPVNCDNKCKSFEVTKEKPPQYCGDGICQSSETKTTCPQDCKDESKCGDGICQLGETIENCPQDCKAGKLCPGWWEYETTQIEKDYGFMYWRALFGNPKEVPIQVCKIKSWIYPVIIGGVILILGIILIVVWKPKRNIKTKKRFKR